MTQCCMPCAPHRAGRWTTGAMAHRRGLTSQLLASCLIAAALSASAAHAFEQLATLRGPGGRALLAGNGGKGGKQGGRSVPLSSSAILFNLYDMSPMPQPNGRVSSWCSQVGNNARKAGSTSIGVVLTQVRARGRRGHTGRAGRGGA